MNKEEFLEVVRTFVDSADSIVEEKGHLLFRAREQDFELELLRSEGGIRCREGGDTFLAEDWICYRLARLDALAQRIEEYIPVDPLRVPIPAVLTDFIDRNDFENLSGGEDAEPILRNVLDSNLEKFCTSVLYLTSDAGEGKTKLLESLSRSQAIRYKDRASKWLLLPVTLGGRGFLRLDDVIAGSLANRFRFPFLYFDSVVALARMGRVVLALDGFEEMFIESAAGDAVSSLGNMLRRLQSSGQVVVSARKAFFRYKSLATQSRVRNTFGDLDVEFAELGLQRWARKQFVQLCGLANLSSGESLFEAVSEGVGEDHPLVTRAVLARRLVEEYKETDDKEALLRRLVNCDGERYFDEFVTVLLERESKEKWIDRAGTDAAGPLLSIDEHHALLSMVAEEMWRSRIETLSASMLETVADLASADRFSKPPDITRQVRQRVVHHALLVPAEAIVNQYQFDHEDFRNYYLGRRIGEILCDSDRLGDLGELLSLGIVPELTLRTAVSVFEPNPTDRRLAAKSLSEIAAADASLSFTRSNCGSLAMTLLAGTNGEIVELTSLHFPTESLTGRYLEKIHFEGCTFEATGLAESSLVDLEFTDCSIDSLRFSDTLQIANVESDQKSLPRALIRNEGDVFGEGGIFEPAMVQQFLASRGWLTKNALNSGEEEKAVPEPNEADLQLKIAIRALKLFVRSTGVNENTFRAKLGMSAPEFFQSVLPVLEGAGVIAEIRYRGSGSQTRYRLVADLVEIERAKNQCDGTLPGFLRDLEKQSLEKRSISQGRGLLRNWKPA